MRAHMAVQITIYLNEADEWQHRPLHLEILNYLRQENVARSEERRVGKECRL